MVPLMEQLWLLYTENSDTLSIPGVSVHICLYIRKIYQRELSKTGSLITVSSILCCQKHLRCECVKSEFRSYLDVTDKIVL